MVTAKEWNDPEWMDLIFFRGIPTSRGMSPWMRVRSTTRRPSWFCCPLPQAQAFPLMSSARAWSLPQQTSVMPLSSLIRVGVCWIRELVEKPKTPSLDWMKRQEGRIIAVRSYKTYSECAPTIYKASICHSNSNTITCGYPRDHGAFRKLDYFRCTLVLIERNVFLIIAVRRISIRVFESFVFSLRDSSKCTKVVHAPRIDFSIMRQGNSMHTTIRDCDNANTISCQDTIQSRPLNDLCIRLRTKAQLAIFPSATRKHFQALSWYSRQFGDRLMSCSHLRRASWIENSLCLRCFFGLGRCAWPLGRRLNPLGKLLRREGFFLKTRTGTWRRWRSCLLWVCTNGRWRSLSFGRCGNLPYRNDFGCWVLRCRLGQRFLPWQWRFVCSGMLLVNVAREGSSRNSRDCPGSWKCRFIKGISLAFRNAPCRCHKCRFGEKEGSYPAN